MRKFRFKTRHALEGPIMWWLDPAVFSSNMPYFRKKGVNCEVSETANKVFLNMLRCILKFGGHDVPSCLIPTLYWVISSSPENIKLYIQVDWTKYQKSILYKISAGCISYNKYKNRKSKRPSVLRLARQEIRLIFLFLEAVS